MKPIAQDDAHCCDANKEYYDGPDFLGRHFSSTEEQIAKDKVKHSPKDIYGGGRRSLARWI